MSVKQIHARLTAAAPPIPPNRTIDRKGCSNSGKINGKKLAILLLPLILLKK